MSILEGSVTGSVAGSLQLNGEGGTDNYQELINRPQLNGITVEGNHNPDYYGILSEVNVNGVSVVTGTTADITIPPAPNVPVQDVTVNGTSCMVGTTAEITIPPAPSVPVQDVEVNGSSVVIGGVAEINIPPTPTIPVTDVEVNNASVVSGTVAEINIPVLDVKVDGASVVDGNGDANITLPEVPVQDVEVDGASVVDADGIAQITLPTVPVQDVEVDGASVVDADGIAQITLPVIPTIPVTDVEVNGSSVMSGTVANIVLIASDVSYDNTNSGYTASQTQDAIDEAASNISDNASDISDLQTNVGDFSTPLDTTAQDCHDAINELKGTLPAYSYYDFAPKVQVQRYGHVVSLSVGAWYNFADLVLPVQYRPNTQIYTLAEQRDGNNTNLGAERITINTDGTVQPNYAGVSFMGLLTWIID